MSRQIEAGKAGVSIWADRSRLASGLAAAQKQLRAFVNNANGLGGALKTGAAAVLGSGAFAMFVKSFADVGGGLDDMSQRTGASVEALSGLGYAAKMTGASIEDIEKGIRTMQKGLVAGDASFAALGLSIEALRGMSPDKQFKAVADSIATISDPAERASKAMEIFGKSGASLVPLLSGGANGIEALTSEAEKNGAVMSGEQAEAAAKLGDAIDLVFVSFSGLVNTISGQVAPLFTTLLQIVTHSINMARQWIDANQGLALAITLSAAAVGAFGVGLITAAGLAYALSVAISTVGAVASAVSVVFGVITSILTGGLAIPIALVVASLAALAAYFIYASGAGSTAMNWLGSKFQMLQEISGTVFKGIQDAMSGGKLGLAAEIGWDGIHLAWLKGTAGLRATWDSWINGLLGMFDRFVATVQKTWNQTVGWIYKSTEAIEKENSSLDSGVAGRAAGRDAAARDKRESAIKALEAKLAESVAQAAESAATTATATKAQQVDIESLVDSFENKTAIAEEATATAVVQSVKRETGTFSGFAAGLLGQQGGRNIDQDILDENKRQSDFLATIVRQMEQKKGAVFA